MFNQMYLHIILSGAVLGISAVTLGFISVIFNTSNNEISCLEVMEAFHESSFENL